MIHSLSRYTGLGFRRDFASDLLNQQSHAPAFLEIAPENWMGIGGYWKKILESAREQYSITLHGLSLSLGGPDELDWKFLNELKQFIREYRIDFYSEHLSFAKCNNAHLYDLLPIPLCMDAVKHVAERIIKVQDFLGMQIAIENVSYYVSLEPKMSESDFINEIIHRAGCGLLLDVNNVFVNATNHQYDTREFIQSLPLNSVQYIHMAGHERIAEDLIIDTHGEAIVPQVYELLDFTLPLLPTPVPVLLERDFNINGLSDLFFELNNLERLCQTHYRRTHAVA